MSEQDKKPYYLRKANTPHLKLVVSNPPSVQAVSNLSHPVFSNARFSVKVISRGRDLYEMNTQDTFHDMECDLILDIEEKDHEKVVVCHFPVFLDKSNKFLDEDEDLYGIIAVQFQMNVLEQLFLFCLEHDASQLTIYMDDAQADGFGIYQDFFAYCDETLTENGERTEIIIPTNRKVFGKWRTFMKKTNFGFEQSLWREQGHNPAIRYYLKSRAHI